MFLPVFVCLSVCLLARLLKNACMDLDEMLLVDRCRDVVSPISYKRCYTEFYVGKIPLIRIGGPLLQRGVVLKWFYSLSRRNTFVEGTCAPLSALLVRNDTLE